MGCESSKAKDSADYESENAAEFMNLSKKNPVAKLLLEEWTLFVDAQNAKNGGDFRPAEELLGRSKEVWATNESNPIPHRAVDHVGKCFLEFIKEDLSQRGWGGTFDYKVAGVSKQGFLKASATIDTAFSDMPEEVSWEIKIHYHSAGA